MASSWFRDYVYIPLGGNRVSYPRHLLNLFITFLVSGIWHGANWTFIAWGALHGVYLIIENIKIKFMGEAKADTLVSRVLNTILCFILVTIGWIFFKANSIMDGWIIFSRIFTNIGPLFIDLPTMIMGCIGILILVVKDFVDEFYAEKRLLLDNKHLFIRWGIYVGLLALILSCGVFDGGQFIYFQF